MRKKWLRPLSVFLLSLSLFATLAWLMHAHQHKQAQALFDDHSARLTREVATRMTTTLYGLNGARGLYAASGQVSRAGFRAYVASRDLPREFPGALGFSFNQRVLRQDLGAFLAATRADGAPALALRQLSDRSHDDLYIVKYIEPAGPHATALGLDIGSDPLRRRALQQAIDSGQASMSAPISLVQMPSQKPEPGVLLMVPVYAHGTQPAAVAERRAGVLGLLVAPVLLREALAGLSETSAGLMDLEIVDSTPGDASDQLMYDDLEDRQDSADFTPSPVYVSQTSLPIMGRQWSLHFGSRAAFNDSISTQQPWIIVILGALFSLFLTLSLHGRGTQTQRLSELVKSTTRGLDTERQRLQAIFETVSEGIHILDATGLLVDANNAFLNLLGLDRFAIGSLRVPDWDKKMDPAQVARQIRSLLDASGYSVFESQNICADGRLIDVEITVKSITIDGKERLYCASRDITGQKRNAALLQEKERQFQALIDNMPNLVAYWDTQQINQFGNLAYAPWFGVDGGSMPGKHLREVIGERLYQLNRPYVEAALRGEFQTFERVIPSPDGQFSRQSLVQYIPDLVAGQVQGFFVLVFDITDIKQANELVRASEQSLNEAQALAQMGSYNTDLETGIWTPSATLREIFGIDDAYVTTMDKLYTLVAPEWVHEVSEHFQRALQGHGHFNLDYQVIRHHDGQRRWVRSMGKVSFDAQAKPVQLTGTLQDITEQRLEADKLRRADELLRTSLETIDEAFVIYDPQDRLVFCNEKYRQTYAEVAHLMVPGVAFEVLIRAGAEQGAYLEALGRVDAWVAERLAEHGGGNQGLIQRMTNGRVLRIVERQTAEGYNVGFRIDITEQYQARQAAEAASRAKSAFLATMSHELRTPLNGILGMAQLLVKPVLPEAERLLYGQTILQSGRMLLMLLNDILDVSKIEANKLTLECIALDVCGAFDDIRALFGDTARSKGLQMDALWQGPADARYLGDPARLRQMISNLVSNAIKFTAAGFVQVNACELERRDGLALLEFSVSDSGVGLSPEQQGLLFQAFSQADSSITRHFGGTGLGLSIVKSLAERMGGSVGVDSDMGQGSRFWFRIRLALETPAQPASAGLGPQDLELPAQTLPAQRIAARILVAEDNPVNRMVVRALLGNLERFDLAIEMVEDGQQALDFITAGGTPDVVLMDVQMPVLDGLAATRKIRQWEAVQERRAVPIIALTANAYDEDRRHCLDAGMDDFLAKPLDLAQLEAMLLQYLA